MQRRKFTGNLLKSAGVLTLLPATLFSKAQRTKKDTLITLTVDTEGIQSDDVPASVYLSDNQGGEGESPTDYVTPIDTGMKVKWEGVAMDEELGHKVVITKIEIKGGGNASVLKQKNYSGNGNVTGNAVDNYNEGVDSYMIRFKVIKGGGRPKDFMLDPKLKLNPD